MFSESLAVDLKKLGGGGVPTELFGVRSSTPRQSVKLHWVGNEVANDAGPLAGVVALNEHSADSVVDRGS